MNSFPSKKVLCQAVIWCLLVYTMNSQWRRGWGGDRCSKVLGFSRRRPYLCARSDVIRIVFSLLMSSFIGGPIGPPAVGKVAARTPWGRGLMYTDTVEELPGYPLQNSSSGSFLFWGGSVGRGGLVYDIGRRGCPRRTPWTTCVHLYAFVFHRRLSPQFQFSLSLVTL